jgi:hypothetical protein
MLRDQFLELIDIRLFLRLHLFPELLEGLVTFCVREVLVVAPHSVEASAQFVNQIVIVIFATTRLSNVLIFFLGHCGHCAVPFDAEPSGSGGD